MAELCDLTGHELARILRGREASAADVAESALARIGDVDDRLHAFLLVTADRARHAAERVDHLFSSGEDLPNQSGMLATPSRAARPASAHLPLSSNACA